MENTQLEIAELTLALCNEAIVQRCSAGKITIKDLTLYLDTLKHCEFCVQYYKDKEQQTEW